VFRAEGWAAKLYQGKVIASTTGNAEKWVMVVGYPPFLGSVLYQLLRKRKTAFAFCSRHHNQSSDKRLSKPAGGRGGEFDDYAETTTENHLNVQVDR
jgi:hypothetical protein